MPDWRDPEQYEFTKALRDTEWAWEFLRRNEDYQREWQDALEAFDECRRAAPEKYEWVPPRVHDEFYIPPVPENERTFPKQWHLAAFVDPDQDTPKSLFFFPPAFETYSFYAGLPPGESDLSTERRVELKLAPYQLAAVFDLRWVLQPQFDRDRKYLSFEQQAVEDRTGRKPKQKRLHRRKWCEYLRVLDARAVGASNYEISRVLFPELPDDYPDHQGSKRAANCYRRAMKLVRGEYRSILA